MKTSHYFLADCAIRRRARDGLTTAQAAAIFGLKPHTVTNRMLHHIRPRKNLDLVRRGQLVMPVEDRLFILIEALKHGNDWASGHYGLAEHTLRCWRWRCLSCHYEWTPAVRDAFLAAGGTRAPTGGLTRDRRRPRWRTPTVVEMRAAA